MNTLKKVIIALTLSTLGFTFTSNATPITLWDWEVDSAFTSFIPGGPDVIGSTDNHHWLDPTILTWGTPVGTFGSSLDVSSGSAGHVTGEDLANGASTITSSLTHNNFIITGSTLTSATLSTKLFLAPADIALSGAIPPLLFDIVFKETPNNGSGCIYSGDPEEGTTLPLCENDIFVVDAFGTDIDENGIIEGIEYNPFTNSFNQQFSLGAYTYNIGLSVDTLAQLDEVVCDRVAGADDDCIGVTTEENKANTFNVHMTITQVPEPSTILLMSLALFGIVANMRKKHS
ncbi:THxN family PEP-CTERM protein [Colwellia psychrerythraea]|uniref:PEP motif putative anchor domain protein n=1 Tax=Colwellia psychrerythraea TaxID=28229 RepID=A0A099KH83_COLPS|nr:THxN family PEP-CTERM protein [Colwellia psychrerythraea]KGJ89701.1 PEP motif putative anchor domain protein [Colwellia psychrerythraea]